MSLLHDIGTGLYHSGIRAAAPFVPKARAWVEGRRGLWPRLAAKAPRLQGCLWMHCASTGEFEQGRPVLEAILARHPQRPVLITFHSPSGYEAFRELVLPGHRGTLHVDYLPADSAAHAQRLVSLVAPALVLWVRYEFWWHHLHALHRAHVPTYLVSGIFRPSQAFFRWYGGMHRRMLRCFTHLFTQDQASLLLLKGIGITNASVSGDTRFDRVNAIVKAGLDVPIAKAFRGAGPMLLCGSTWPQDEQVLLKAFATMRAAPKCLVVPHELDPAHLAAIEAKFPKPLVRWSELEGTTPENIAAMLGDLHGGTLVMDRVGLLARTYRHADVAFVGGGFVDGIHSVLEAAAWGVPVVFGPHHHKFLEAQGLIDAGGGFSVRDAAQLHEVLERLLTNPNDRIKAGAAAGRYVHDRMGATERVLHVLAANGHG